MANSLDVRVIHDGHHNAVVKLVGIVDTSDVSAVSAVPLANFITNPPGMTLNGLKVQEIEFSCSHGLIVVLGWNAATEQPIAVFANTGELGDEDCVPFNPDRTAAGYDGSINLSTRGFVPGSIYGFTVILKCVKQFAA